MIRQALHKMPDRLRLPLLTAIYGVVGGLAAVAFMESIHWLFDGGWGWLTALSPARFLIASFLVITVSSLAAGVLMSTICPGAAGSGIPQLKTAYWNDMGLIPFRAVFVKFIGGIIALVGGASLGREGPTVVVASGMASNVAGWLGIGRRKRRRAAVAGAAAGLAAAFNTPLAAISFVLEEILGDFNSRLLGGVMVASVTGAFIVFALIGSQPSFLMPVVKTPSWNIYVAVPVSAVLASLAGVLFQRGSLALRSRMKTAGTRLPGWARPLLGGLIVWAIGSAIFLGTGRIGIFGLGYNDLSAAMADGIAWKLAAILAAGKLVATIASYGTGGCGGIFSPTLFIGAMCGFAVAGLMGIWVPLSADDRLIIAAAGMCACFGAVVRAPVTAVLMVFEMTHQFSMVPALLLASLISQGIARLAGRENFYDGILEQDERGIHRVTPPRNLAVWRGIEVSALGVKKPVALTDLSLDAMRHQLERYPYRCFPVVLSGQVVGVTTRSDIEHALEREVVPQMEKPVILTTSQTVGEIESRLIDSRAGLFLISEQEGGPIVGVFTLHDLIRTQADIFE